MTCPYNFCGQKGDQMNKKLLKKLFKQEKKHYKQMLKKYKNWLPVPDNLYNWLKDEIKKDKRND